MKKVRFGVVGTNFITDWMIAGARQDSRFELAAVCSRTRERAEFFAAKHNIPFIFTSLEEMVESDLIDAVYIASPNFLHSEQSIMFMSRGKHVLCEKPLASNAREAREMAEASERYNVTLMEAMKTTLMPNFAAVRENLPRIGRVRRYFSSYCQYSSRYDKYKAGIIENAFRKELSNGAVMDIGVYTIYPMVALFGKPEEIRASAILLGTGVDGQGTVSFRYNDMEATVLYSKIADSSLPTEIQGEEGNIYIDRINLMTKAELRPRKAKTAASNLYICDIEDISRPADRNEYYYEMAEFIDTVLAGRRESATNSHRNSITVLEITDEIRRQTGVVFPADK